LSPRERRALGLEEIPGITDPKVATASQVLHGEVSLGDRVVVIGGGIVGTEVGLMVAEAGKRVTFIEMLDEFMCNITFDERQVYELRFQDLDVSINTGQRLVEVTAGGVKTVDRCGTMTEFPADTVVLAAGFRPDRELVTALAGQVEIQVAEAGDCVRPRKIYDANPRRTSGGEAARLRLSPFKYDQMGRGGGVILRLAPSAAGVSG
jgi:2-enoate reductase